MRLPAEPQLAALAKLLPTFPDTQVVVAGDLVADEYVYGETERVSREAPVLIVRYERSELKAGGAGNAARNLAALNVNVKVVGVVGADSVGTALMDDLEATGIDVSCIQSVRGRHTEVKTRILAGGRSTRRQQMLRVDRAPLGPLSSAVQARFARDLDKLGRGANAVLASDYGSGALGPHLVDTLRSLKRRGIPTCVDSRYGLRFFTGLTMAKPNEVELEAASGMSLEQPNGLERAGRALLKALACDQLLVTRGRNGMALFRKGSVTVHIPAYGAHDAVDVTGAGDTVAATYCAGVAAGADPVSAARLANVAASLVVLKPGTATVGREELLAELLRVG